MNFTAIDVETANADMESICQIGLARYENGQLVEEWCQLVDPEDWFDDINVGIHGITEKSVKGQPTLPEVQERIREFLEGTVAVCHTHFDRVSVSKAYCKYGLTPINTQWLDSARVARRAWQDSSNSGYGLSTLCQKLGYVFKHHDALEDAKAAGHVLLSAIQDSGLGLDQWLDRVNQRIKLGANGSGTRSEITARAGNPDGALRDEIIVFTGSLSMPRSQAADLAAKVGCDVASGVTKKTTILVVGDQDIRHLAGHDKSIKHRKAEELIAAGQSIRILSESDFQMLVAASE